MVGINSNLIAGSATRNLGAANSIVSGSVARLSSGNRIIKASDDVAGLAIGTSIQSTVKTLEIALLNTQQANSVLSIADGALQQIGDILTRQNSLASQANSGSLGSTERGFLNQEFQALVSEIDRIVGSTTFNGITLLNGSLGSASGSDLDATPTVSAAYDVVGEGTTTITSIGTFGGTFDEEFVGSLANAQVFATSVSTNSIALTIQVGDKVFTATDTNTGTGVSLTFTEVASGLTFVIADGNVSTANATEASAYAALIETDLQSATVYQVRTFETTTGGLPSTNTEGTVLAGLSGADVTFKSSTQATNSAPTIGAFSITAATSTTDFSATVTVGGVSYSTTTTVNGVVDAANGVAIDTLALGGGTGVLRLYKDGDATTNPDDYIQIDLATNSLYTNLSVANEENAQSLETALNSLFGVGNNGALSFQVGANVTDSISVSISSALTTDIYEDDDGVVQTLDITTQAGAQEAIEVVGNAISTIIGRRADVGAAISRFNFAASNLEVSISNQDAARGSFLDADIATESTAFATAQVKLQASVAVLAQANALPRTLLSLLQ